jgi:hypothetical protein
MRWYFLFFIPILGCTQHPASNPNYYEIFGADYEYAVNKIEENSWWADTLVKNNIDPQFALSVIFPELIRYSSISDFIEVKALEVLYVQYGKDYSDFSIGLFQMKPEFAEIAAGYYQSSSSSSSSSPCIIISPRRSHFPPSLT